jgi:hypothetical protein
MLLLLSALGLCLGGWLAWRSSVACSRVRQVVIVLARVLGLACLVVIALNPGQWKQKAEPASQRWALLVDRSHSMGTSDVAGKARWQAALALARDARAAAAQADAMEVYTFANGLEQSAPDALATRTPDGRSSDILGALQGLLDQSASRGVTLNGVLLVSDGRQVGGVGHADVAARACARNVPVYTVALGAAVQVPDLRLDAVRRHVVAFKGQPAPIALDLSNTGLGALRVNVRLRTADGTVLEERPVEVKDGERIRVRFDPKAPAKAGYVPLVAEVSGGPGDKRPDTDRVAIGLLVIDTRLKVFVAEGEPFWDSKFLVQLLRKMPVADVTSVYRLAPDRFFRVENDLAKASEAPVAQFPETDEALDAYDLVVLGKGAEYLLNAERVARLRRFVTEHGGCLLFARSKPYRRELPEIEPLEVVAWDAPLEGSFRLQPTVAGEEAGVFGDLLPGVGDLFWQRMPALKQMQGLRPSGAFAQVLAEGVDGGRRVPLLVSQRLGKGMIVNVNADGLWQWSFFPDVAEAADTYARFWTQIVQWSATGADFLPGQQFALQADAQSVDPGVPVRLRARGREDRPAGPPGIEVRRDGKLQRTIVLGVVPGATRLWETLAVLNEPGTYELALKVAPEEGAAPSVTLVVRPPAGEDDNPSADPDFLTQLATQSGGKAIAPADLAATVRALEPRPTAAARGETVWQPRWDRAWLLLAMVAFFGVEWFVRRRSGLT